MGKGERKRDGDGPNRKRSKGRNKNWTKKNRGGVHPQKKGMWEGADFQGFGLGKVKGALEICRKKN